jgi:hypothetical protein
MTIRVWSVAALAAVLVLLGTAAPAFSQPNLAVTQMFVNPDPPKANLALDLRFAVLNNGSAANPSGYQLGVSCVNKNPSGPPCAFANTSLPLLQIAPGTTTNVYCWNLFEAVADPWQVVPESSETNNKSSATSSGE